MTPVLLCVVFAAAGALVYFYANDGKLSELGRLTFGAAMLVLIYLLAGHR
jgi:hypothetical protein